MLVQQVGIAVYITVYWLTTKRSPLSTRWMVATQTAKSLHSVLLAAVGSHPNADQVFEAPQGGVRDIEGKRNSKHLCN